MDSFIEFGDFKVANLFISTNACVELPPSWSQNNETDPRLSFFCASEDGLNGLPIDDEMLLSQIFAISRKDFSSQFRSQNGDSKRNNDVTNSSNSFAGFQHHSMLNNNGDIKDMTSNLINHPPSEPHNLTHSQSKIVNSNQPITYENSIPKSSNQPASNEQRQSMPSCEFLKTNSGNSKSALVVQEDSTNYSKIPPSFNHQDAVAHVYAKDENQLNMTELPTIDDWASVSNGIAEQTLHGKSDLDSLNYISTSENVTTSATNTSQKDIENKNIRKNSTQKKPTIILVKPRNDPHAKYFADEISRLRLVCRPQAFIPRGLVNSNNWCYVNATLQALLVCPPFFHMLRKLYFTCKEDRQKTSTPIMDSFVLLASEFRTMSYQYCLDTKARDLIPGAPFSPDYIYDMLSVIESSLTLKGGQEDAEEFLSCILNGFHEEILSLFNLLENDDEMSDDENSIGNSFGGDIDASYNSNVNCTIKSKTMVATKARVCSHTPISNIFRGELCTIVIRSGQKPSVTEEPFFTLPIDVNTEHTWSVEDALYHLTEKENFVPNGIEQSVLRHQTIAQLPPILILHLKRFVYDKNGGLLKINKAVHFKNDLVIQPDWLTDTAPPYSIGQRSYKLFAVVYHHGERATGGHYSTDVFHFGKTGWLRIDDQKIWPIHQNDVTKHNINRTPYLLYYRQMFV